MGSVATKATACAATCAGTTTTTAASTAARLIVAAAAARVTAAAAAALIACSHHASSEGLCWDLPSRRAVMAAATTSGSKALESLQSCFVFPANL